MDIHGQCEPQFEAVQEEFARNFGERGDLGASCCVYVEGQRVVDIWGGVANRESGAAWERESITVMMSATKGAVALSAHMLLDRGDLDFDLPVAHYWPAFAQNGKERVTVRMLLTHQAGLPGIRERVPKGKIYDWDYVISTLEKQSTMWEPGTAIGYHPMTYGWLVGEVIRRVSGLRLGEFVREEIAKPLDLDFWIGLPESEFDRFAPLHPNPEDPLQEALEHDPDPNSNFRLAMENTGGHLRPGSWNCPDALRAELGGGGGVSNARSLARLYAPLSLDGSLDGVRLVRPESIVRLGTVEAAITHEQTMGMTCQYTLGLERIAVDGAFPEQAFGHFGWGGSLGYADPENHVAFGFVPNQMGTTPRAEALTGALYRSLGFEQRRFGLWMR
ncbi:MAG: serine hydrolase domain-containing protein [Chloroflexota bacterium]